MRNRFNRWFLWSEVGFIIGFSCFVGHVFYLIRKVLFDV